MTEPAQKYINSALNGEILLSSDTKATIHRHLRDLDKKDSLYYYDPDAGSIVVDFFSILKHYKGEYAGYSFELEPWQEFIICCLFGWKKKSDNNRRFKYSYIEIPRKNGKTTLAAGIACYMAYLDGEEGAEIYTGATMSEQAKICFEDIKNMILGSKLLSKRSRVLTHNISIPASKSRITYVSNDAKTLDGLNTQCAVLDETHAYRNSSLYDVFVSSIGSRRQPLIFMITTAGFNKDWFCYTYRKSVLQVVNGVVEDETLFGIVYKPDDSDQWDSIEAITKSNPNKDVSVSTEYLLDQVHKARIRPTETVNVKTKHLNIWTDTQTSWIPDNDYMAAGSPFTDEDLKGLKCYGGLDLASTTDFASFSLIFHKLDGTFYLMNWSFLPKESAQKRYEDGLVQLWNWVEKGHVILTEKRTTDYAVIKAFIIEKYQKYAFEFLAKDKWNSSHLVQELEEVLPKVYSYDKKKYISRVSDFSQSMQTMSTPTKEFEKMIYENLLNHGNNPLLRWMCSNVSLIRDANGNIKVDKAKSSESVDGIVASIMALGEFMTHNWTTYQSVYENRGLTKV